LQKKGPKTVCKAKIGIGYSSFAISRGRAITVGNTNDEDTLWCFDTQSDEIVWKQSYSEKLAPKYYDGDLLLCLPCTKGAAMVALDKITGKMKWKSSNTARPGYSTPVFFKNTRGMTQPSSFTAGAWWVMI